MPFFYSQYLKKDEKVKADPRRVASRTNTHTANAVISNGRQSPSNRPRRPSLTRGPGSGRLVWHSNIGSSGKRDTNYKPLKYSADGKKVVHFSTIEVQPFHFDWSLANDVFYTRKELSAMGQSRFDDAATLRQKRHQAENGGHAMDDVDISKRSKVEDITTLLSSAFDDPDRDDNVSIRGIEHFVYPDLQQEMIRRKKEVQREVMGFVRSKRPDPQGWRLAQHSRSFSQWARNVALEKGMKYCMNNAAGDPEIVISKNELERFQKSRDELEDASHCLRGSSSFSAGSSSFDVENPSSLRVLHEIAENGKTGDDKEGDQDESRESQPAGADTGED